MSRIYVKSGEIEISAEGTDRFVEKQISLLKKEFFGVEKFKGEKQVAGGKKKDVKIEEQTLLDFFNEKKPSTHYDKISVFGYYLTRQGSQKAFKKSDVEECYKELVRYTKLPGDLTVTLQDTIRNTGYIKHIGKEGYVLTSTGINHVTHELPSRAE